MNIHIARVSELLRFTQVHKRHSESLARATGERFNVFEILGIGHYEVKTHSPMLGALLDPKGHHGQGGVFLRLFLDRFGITDFDAGSETAKLHLEYYIGQVNENSGGRIDIVVEDGKGSTIFVENKIYAADQENQLKRYRERDPMAHLFYLTLYGDKPSGLTEAEIDEIRFECVSYASDILSWLNACCREAACLPHLRETISQYIHLVEKLTNQSSTTRMNNDLINEIVKSKDSLSAFFALIAEQESVRRALIAQLDTQLDGIAKAAGLIRDGRIQNLHNKYAGFYFKTKGLEAHNLRIGCAFDRRDYQDLCFGFKKHELSPPCSVAQQLLARFRERFPSYVSEAAQTEWWPAAANFEDPYRHWNAETFEAIHSRQFAQNLEGKLKILAEIARQICPDESFTQSQAKPEA
jgi:hypothetical protein